MQKLLSLIHSNLGQTYEYSKKPSDAVLHYEKSYVLSKEVLGEDDKITKKRFERWQALLQKNNDVTAPSDLL